LKREVRVRDQDSWSQVIVVFAIVLLMIWDRDVLDTEESK
jgi:hypothetical protein